MSLSPEQQKVRATGLGSSDIGAVAGLNPWTSPLDVWLVKRGFATVAETPAMRLGTRMEPVVADLYSEEHLPDGEMLALPSQVWEGSVHGTLRHPAHAFALASPDRAVIRGALAQPDRVTRLVEIKTASIRQAHHWGTEHDAVPDWYRAQIEWQMEVCGVDVADLAVLLGGAELRVYRIHRDPELAARLLEIGREFWRHVETGTEPPIDGTESWRRYLEDRFPRHRTPLKLASREATGWARQLAEARATIEAAEAAKAEAENHLRAAIGDAEGVEGEGWRATWKTPASGSVDWKGLAESLGATPEQRTQFTRPASRRFLFTTK